MGLEKDKHISMSPKEYEELVTSMVVADFSGFEDCQVDKNRQFTGVRQPGSYEIDIAVTFKISGIIDFQIIFECKCLSRKVDRPIVQKLIQTRDAISAHKGIIVSNIGFTDEAIAVARANGIGLWIIGYSTRVVVMGDSGPRPTEHEIINIRTRFAKLIGFSEKKGTDAMFLNQDLASIDPLFETAYFIKGPATFMKLSDDIDSDKYPAFTFSGSRVPDAYSALYINARFGMCQIFNDIFRELVKSETPIHSEIVDLIKDFATLTTVQSPIKKLGTDELTSLFSLACFPLNCHLVYSDFYTDEARSYGIDRFFDTHSLHHLKQSTVILPKDFESSTSKIHKFFDDIKVVYT